MATQGDKWLRGKQRTPGLAERLRRARRENGLTQEQVAEAVKVGRRAVNLWETGRTEPTQSRLESLAALYGKDLDWFITGAGDALTQRIETIRDRIAKLPEDYLDAIDAILNTFEKTSGVNKR